jgi:hypothetical protein
LLRNAGAGKACAALAESLVALGDTASAIKHLERYLEIATRANSDSEQADACTALGSLHFSLGALPQRAPLGRQMD